MCDAINEKCMRHFMGDINCSVADEQIAVSMISRQELCQGRTQLYGMGRLKHHL